MSILQHIHVADAASAIPDAWSLQQACAQVGFDWFDKAPVFSKVAEELAEVNEAVENPHKAHADIEEELGDLLFACVNLARHLQVEPAQSLCKANAKFKARFEEVERLAKQQHKTLTHINAEQYEHLWQQAKVNMANGA